MGNSSALTHVTHDPSDLSKKYIADQDGHFWEGNSTVGYLEYNTGFEAGSAMPAGIYCSKKVAGKLHIVGGNNWFPNTGVYGLATNETNFAIKRIGNSLVRGIDFEPTGLVGIACDVIGRLYRTEDGGTTWLLIYDASGSLFEGCYKVKYNNGGWIVSCEGGISLQSIDGMSWIRRVVGTVDGNGRGYAHAALDWKGNLVVIGSQGYQILVSENNGANYNVLMSLANLGFGQFFRSAAIVSDTLFYLSGDVGVVVKVEKVSGIWTITQVNTKTAADLNGIDVADVLIVVGMGETIIESTDLLSPNFTKKNGDITYDKPSLVLPIGPPSAPMNSILPKKSTGRGGK